MNAPVAEQLSGPLPQGFDAVGAEEDRQLQVCVDFPLSYITWSIYSATIFHWTTHVVPDSRFSLVTSRERPNFSDAGDEESIYRGVPSRSNALVALASGLPISENALPLILRSEIPLSEIEEVRRRIAAVAASEEGGFLYRFPDGFGDPAWRASPFWDAP